MKITLPATGWTAVASAIFLSGCEISPIPLSSDELAESANDKLQRVTADQEPIGSVVTLKQAIARALKYNLDHKVEQFEASLRTAELRVAHFNLLPNVVATSGYAGRDEPLASSSYNLVTKAQNFGFSTSQDQRLRTSDLTFSWHVLDFGLSLVRARQAADKVLIAEEGRRKVVHRLLEDVRTAYWRAWTAQQLVSKLRRLEGRTKSALFNSRSLSKDRATSPITAVTYRRELIEIQRTLQELQRELAVARYQLAALINVMPGTRFTLAAPSTGKGHLPSGDMRAMVSYALENRAELRDVAYRRRINLHEADAALLDMLPGVQLLAGNNWDSNSFALHDQWLSWGAKASWNLIKIFQYPAKRSAIEAHDKLLDQRALALTMAIMTQVYVSKARLIHFTQELETAHAYHKTQSELVGYIRAEHRADRVSEQTLLREELNAAVGEIRLNLARAAVENAYGNLLATIGRDPLPDGQWNDASIAEIGSII